MNKTYVLALAALFFAAPMSYAHVDGLPYGTPKLYCEDSPLAGDQVTHDYGPPALGFLIALGSDWSTPNGAYPLLPGGCAYAADVPNQWDGHYEYALGGTFLLACEAGCGDNSTGAGSLGCFGTYADHPPFPTIWVFDHVLSTLGADVPFAVAADYLDNIPDPTGTEPACGDFESDFSADCTSHCIPPFPPGQDGSYQVYVTGTLGHIWTSVSPPPQLPECIDQADNDSDGFVDAKDRDCYVNGSCNIQDYRPWFFERNPASGGCP